MKPALLNGPNSKPLKNGGGRYNTVPFRHYTPKGQGEGASYLSINAIMPPAVYKKAVKLTRSVPNPATGKTQWGQALDWNKEQRIRPSPDPSQWQDYQHKFDIFHGMYRMGTAKHTTYLTFRRVSTPRTVTLKNGQVVHKGSDPNSWIHPSTPPNPIIQSVYDFCMPHVEQYIKGIIEQSLQ